MMPNEKKILDNDTALDLIKDNQPIDFASYDIIDLEGCDLGSYKAMRFKKNSEVNLGGIEPLPKELDLSRCASVDLSGRDLSALSKPIIMKEGSSFSFNSRMQSGLGLNDIPPLTNADFSRAAKVSISGTDLSNYQKLDFAPNAAISLVNVKNIPQNTDFSHCQKVNLAGCDLQNQPNLRFKDDAEIDLSGCTNYPENLDLSNCNIVTIKNTDLSQIKSLKFKDSAVVNLSGCTNIPSDLDFSNCKAVYLTEADLSNIKDLKLKDGTYLDLNNCKALPQHVDFDKCNYVNLSHTDLIFRTDIKFKDGAEVNLRQAENLPDEVDFSPCAKLNLRQCDLGSDIIGGERIITFRDGAEVNLRQCTNLPENTDFSTCNKLNLSSCDLSSQTELKLRDNAHVAINGAKNIPSTTDFSRCAEVWINASQTNSFDYGNAHIVLNGLGPKTVDLSNLKNATTSQQSDDILDNSAMTLLGTKEFIFRDRKQYEEYLANPKNLRIPETANITFADDRKELTKALSVQQGELPKITKADAQSRRIDKATSQKAQAPETSKPEKSQNIPSVPTTSNTR